MAVDSKIMSSIPFRPDDCPGICPVIFPITACSLVWMRRGVVPEREDTTSRVLSRQRPTLLLRPRCEASGAPFGHARAYRDVLNDAPAALSVVRRARRLWTLLIKVPLGGCICHPHGGFLSKFGQISV
ncbi:hypothetical protein CRG98_015323 [Punica granatum]|uniref:Uncharacterized protein n=1 Tax=Punica granatum TaxID=22663 RepID=A0A2I0K840_PUNGR|nr:hypothetical protein CRG98_015323 [Punica granatum]